MAMGPEFTGRKLKALLWDGWIMSEWRQLYFLIGKKHVFFSKLGSVVAWGKQLKDGMLYHLSFFLRRYQLLLGAEHKGDMEVLINWMERPTG